LIKNLKRQIFEFLSYHKSIFTYSEIVNFTIGEFEEYIQIANNHAKKVSAEIKRQQDLAELQSKLNNGKYKQRRS